MRSTTHHRTLTTLAVASLVTMLASGCGQGPADRRASELEDSTTEVVAGAHAYVGDPWERLPGSSTAPSSTPTTGGSTGSSPSTNGG